MVKAAGKKGKHFYYERAVQDAEVEVTFINRAYKNLRKKAPLVLREDFCGTAQVCCEWVREIEKGKAHGVDLHGPTLKWGERHNVSALTRDQADRVNLIQKDVRDNHGFKPDVVAALNFSYFIFKERKVLSHYFKCVLKALARDGVLVMDIYGGPDAQKAQEEETDHGDFTYVWDQDSYNPVTGETRCYIHFDFPDGKRMRRAFTYDWRLWDLPELTDLLLEVGFKTVEVYWEGTDEKTGEGNGKFRRTKKGDDSVSWIAYIVAGK